MKILVVHTSAGAGHTKAAEAVLDLLKKNPAYSIFFVDALDYTGPFYKKIYQGSYAFLITKIPWAWGFFFWLTDCSLLRTLVGMARRIINGINARRFAGFLVREQFDWIVSTHFFPNEVISHLKEKSLIRSKTICVVTDFDVHSLWLGKGIDWYTVASDYTRQKMAQLGVDSSKVVVTGIPTHEKFAKEFNRDELKAGLELKKDAFTVLIATGSFGIGPIEKITATLKKYQVIVICGRNRFLFSRLGQRNFRHAKIHGLVHN